MNGQPCCNLPVVDRLGCIYITGHSRRLACSPCIVFLLNPSLLPKKQSRRKHTFFRLRKTLNRSERKAKCASTSLINTPSAAASSTTTGLCVANPNSACGVQALRLSRPNTKGAGAVIVKINCRWKVGWAMTKGKERVRWRRLHHHHLLRRLRWSPKRVTRMEEMGEQVKIWRDESM